jgi:hypothetical protein
LLKEVVRYYGEDNAELLGVMERPLIEAAVMASFLMMADAELILTIASAPIRLQMLRQAEEGHGFYETDTEHLATEIPR